LFGDAARNGHPYALLGLAVLAEHKSNRLLARKYVTDSIVRSPTEMGHRAGLLYLSEIFVARDPDEAARYTKESADQGSWKSQELMSTFYAEGIGVERNVTEAARYEKLAADNPLRDDSRNADAVIDSIGPSAKPH
jgi:TPR repeat protein